MVSFRVGIDLSNLRILEVHRCKNELHDARMPRLSRSAFAPWLEHLLLWPENATENVMRYVFQSTLLNSQT